MNGHAVATTTRYVSEVKSEVLLRFPSVRLYFDYPIVRGRHHDTDIGAFVRRVQKTETLRWYGTTECYEVREGRFSSRIYLTCPRTAGYAAQLRCAPGSGIFNA